MNRYFGNTGRMERLPDRPAPPPPPMPPPPEPFLPPRPRPAPELNKLLRRFDLRRLERDDLLLMAILYLLYRESGEADFLYAIIGYLLL